MVVPIRGGLRHVSDDEPGIRRTGTKRFRYTDTRTGRIVKDRATLERISALAVPPAWTDVWICSDELGHVQATGRDARGRKQYRYHADFRAQREKTKFDELVAFGEALGDLRSAVDTDLRRQGLVFERIVALVVTLLEDTFVRIGNECYAHENKTYGLTTLRRQHVTVEGSTVRIAFVGKAGRRHDIELTDARLCRVIRRCHDLPGQLMFRYEDAGELRAITSTDVNDYLRLHTGLDATAKTFRTWGATLLAASAFAALPPPRTQRQRQVATKAVVETVAGELRNTPAIARASYIHPVVFETYESGALPRLWAAGPARSGHGLIAEERKLLHLLAPRRRMRKAS